MSAVLLVQGDARALPLPDGSVHCVVTSPPYYSLRDYGTGQWVGGEAGCTHAIGKARNDGAQGRHTSSTFHGSMSTTHGGGETYARDTCPRCGAVRVDAQIGLEPLHSCGMGEADMHQLRKDLTPEERAYVIAELRKVGLI